MSKIAEEKALDAYPQKYDNLLDTNVHRRIGYRQGYEQAMQDFLEKAMEYFKGKPIHPFWVEHFKNYMEEEL